MSREFFTGKQSFIPFFLVEMRIQGCAVQISYIWGKSITCGIVRSTEGYWWVVVSSKNCEMIDH